MSTSEEGGRNEERTGDDAGPPARKSAGDAPSAGGAIREGWDVGPAVAVLTHGCYSLDVDEATHMAIHLWQPVGSEDLCANALVVGGLGPPFAAVAEPTGWGARFFARPQGAPVPLRERAVHVDCSSPGHPTIQVVEVRRESSAATGGEGA
jgi:hypothetical protein